MINEFFKNILSQENLKYSFGFKADNAEHTPEVYSCKGNNGILHITFKYTDGVEEDIFVTRNTDKSCTAVRRFRNGSENVPRLNELFCKFSGITFGGVPRDDYFYHLENPRMYVRYCIEGMKTVFSLAVTVAQCLTF